MSSNISRVCARGIKIGFRGPQRNQPRARLAQESADWLPVGVCDVTTRDAVLCGTRAACCTPRVRGTLSAKWQVPSGMLHARCDLP